jgi:hypothetical protein
MLLAQTAPARAQGQPRASFGCARRLRACAGSKAGSVRRIGLAQAPGHPLNIHGPGRIFCFGARPPWLARVGGRATRGQHHLAGRSAGNRTSHRPTAPSSSCLNRTDQCEQTVSARRYLVTMGRLCCFWSSNRAAGEDREGGLESNGRFARMRQHLPEPRSRFENSI